MPYTYQYPRPCVTVDIVVFRATDKGYCILLIKRKNEPFKDAWKSRQQENCAKRQVLPVSSYINSAPSETPTETQEVVQ